MTLKYFLCSLFLSCIFNLTSAQTTLSVSFSPTILNNTAPDTYGVASSTWTFTFVISQTNYTNVGVPLATTTDATLIIVGSTSLDGTYSLTDTQGSGPFGFVPDTGGQILFAVADNGNSSNFMVGSTPIVGVSLQGPSVAVGISATAAIEDSNWDGAVLTDNFDIDGIGWSTGNVTVNAGGSSAPTSMSVAATVFLEGAYNGTNLNTTINGSIPAQQPYNGINSHSQTTSATIPANAVDWVLVEIREAASAALALNSTKVGSAAGFLMSDGTIKATDGTSNLTVSLTGNSGSDFFIVIYHRNHLPIMSASAISESGGNYTIDFTSNSANTYQTTTALATLSGGKFGMPAGDSGQDGLINTTDLSTWQTNNGAVYNYSGSGIADFNLDGEINAVDRNDFQQKNTSKTRQVPST